jgi:cytochrome c oxidase assembly factor CtaG
VLYGVRARRLARRGYPVPLHRIVLFASALALFAVAEAPGIERLDEEHFAVHMTQHLVIGDVAPLLAALGLSGALVRPVLATPAGRRLRPLSDPLVVLPLWVATMVAWHVPRLFDAAVDDDLVHGVQHACFVGAGLLLWSAVLGPLPAPGAMGHAARMAALAVVWVTGGVVANVLLWSGRVLYPAYGDGTGALGEQRLGGGLMLLEMSVTVLAGAVIVGLAWMRDAERRQRVAETRAHASPGRT